MFAAHDLMHKCTVKAAHDQGRGMFSQIIVAILRRYKFFCPDFIKYVFSFYKQRVSDNSDIIQKGW
jgi:hypothetical protein